jgi:NADH-quinone oxidoreductase subunit L
MFRLLTLTFDGEKRWEAGRHPHEAPLTMTIPLVVLALLSVIGGFAGVPASLGGGNAIEHWLDPVFEHANEKMALPGHGVEPIEYVLMVLSVLVALGGVFLARSWYLRRQEIPLKLTQALPRAYQLLLNKYYVDEVYDAAVVTPMVKGSEKLLWNIVDVHVIDWLVNGLARLFGAVSGTVRLLQSGIAQHYMLVFLAGVVFILGWLLVK